MKPLKLFNASELAEETGEARTTIQAAKIYQPNPFIFTHGNKTTMKSWYAWRAANPNFQMSKVYVSRKNSKLDQSNSSTGQARMLSPVGTPGEP